jgi:hypothetical protein
MNILQLIRIGHGLRDSFMMFKQANSHRARAHGSWLYAMLGDDTACLHTRTRIRVPAQGCVELGAIADGAARMCFRFVWFAHTCLDCVHVSMSWETGLYMHK